MKPMAHCISFIWDRSFFYTCKQPWCECENLYGASVIETNVQNTHRLCGQSGDASNVERKTITAFNRRIDPNQMFRLFTINIMDTQTQQQKLPSKNTITQSQTNKITQTIPKRSRKYIDNMIYQFQSQIHFFLSQIRNQSESVQVSLFYFGCFFPLRIYGSLHTVPEKIMAEYIQFAKTSVKIWNTNSSIAHQNIHFIFIFYCFVSFIFAFVASFKQILNLNPLAITC